MTSENPLLSPTSEAWDGLIEGVGPASLLIVIETRMSAALKQRLTPEDIWQEALLHAWRDRSQCQWRGLRSFRSWLLTIIDHRIRDAADYEGAYRRGGGAFPVPFSGLQGAGSSSGNSTAFPGPVGSTTPSRIAVYHEQAEAMRVALACLPEETRDVVRLRLFEQLGVDEVAARLKLGASAVRHRFRKGAELYHRHLMAELGTRSLTVSPEVLRALQSKSAVSDAASEGKSRG